MGEPIDPAIAEALRLESIKREQESNQNEIARFASIMDAIPRQKMGLRLQMNFGKEDKKQRQGFWERVCG